VILEHKDHKEQQVSLELLATQDPKVILDHQDFKDHKEFKDQ
jgi:hypothetical protein